MTRLERFMDMLCGTFDNSQQCLLEDAAGKMIHPRARHIIGICNDRISNLPDDFDGCFVIEESYFDLGDRMIEKHYLFSYIEDGDGKIILKSYDIPEPLKREDLTNVNQNITIDYMGLRMSPRFEPLFLEDFGDEFFGENVSNFSNDTLFKFSLRVKSNTFQVKELLERNGIKVVGYEEPIIYIKVKS